MELTRDEALQRLIRGEEVEIYHLNNWSKYSLRGEGLHREVSTSRWIRSALSFSNGNRYRTVQKTCKVPIPTANPINQCPIANIDYITAIRDLILGVKEARESLSCEGFEPLVELIDKFEDPS